MNPNLIRKSRVRSVAAIAAAALAVACSAAYAQGAPQKVVLRFAADFTPRRTPPAWR